MNDKAAHQRLETAKRLRKTAEHACISGLHPLVAEMPRALNSLHDIAGWLAEEGVMLFRHGEQGGLLFSFEGHVFEPRELGPLFSLVGLRLIAELGWRNAKKMADDEPEEWKFLATFSCVAVDDEYMSLPDVDERLKGRKGEWYD